MSEPKAPRVAVLGAGIAGLSAAYELNKRAERERRRIDVVVLETASRVGGKIVTESRDGAVFELGPDSFLTLKPDALELVDELGLSGELMPTAPSPTTIFIYSQGALKALPSGTGLVPTSPLSLLSMDLLSWKGRARLAMEPWAPAGEEGVDESLASFARRRLGQEALDKIVGPMLGGIFAGDPEKLSLQSAFPQLKDVEAKGGLWRAARAAKRQAGAKRADRTMFMTLKGGLGRLVETLALKLPAGRVRTNAPVQALRRRGGAWRVELRGGEAVEADAVIAAIPANLLSPLVADLDFELSCALGEIQFTSTATVSMLYDQPGLAAKLDGFGFLVPRGENKATTAATYTSTKFPERAPKGAALIRCFLGGAGREAAVDADDAQIARLARAELKEILGLGEAHPRLTRVARWPKANPQYAIGHAMRLRRIASCVQAHPGLHLTGASYEGVGVPDCIRQGRAAGSAAFKKVITKAPAAA